MIARAPMRISFGGGNTDLEPFRSTYGGVCFGVAIKKYAYASPQYENNVSPLVVALKERMQYQGDIGIKVDAKPFSGLGASGSIAVAAALMMANGKLSKRQAAQLAYRVERKDLGVTGGFQDQIFGAFGGMIYIEFNSNEGYEVIPAPRSAFIDMLEKSLLLVYTGERTTTGAGVLEDIIRRNETDVLLEIKEIATEMRKHVSHGNMKEFAELLDRSWTLKKQLSTFVSNPKIDEMYEEALNHGAISGKICGAGGAGYMMLLCDNTPHVQNRLREMGYRSESVEFDWEGMVLAK